MPLENYGVLKGRIKKRIPSSPGRPHYQLLVSADGYLYRAAVNVRSMLHPSEVEYLIRPGFEHPVTEALHRLPAGFHPLASEPGGMALDFIRLNLFNPEEFRILPCEGPECGVDLNEVLDRHIRAAINDDESWIYVFGEPWGPADASDRLFRFHPSRGIHEVHMNQGNDPGHWEQDGIWQDGAVLIEHPRRKEWIGIFLKFQSQSWHTDDDYGHALAPPRSHDPLSRVPLDRNGAPRPDGMLRIIAARLAPQELRDANRGGEAVTLVNVCPFPVDITGWSITNLTKNQWKLRGELAPGEVREVPIGRSVALGIEGGIITLLDKQGLKVHGVSYTKERACQQGCRITFDPVFFPREESL